MRRSLLNTPTAASAQCRACGQAAVGLKLLGKVSERLSVPVNVCDHILGALYDLAHTHVLLPLQLLQHR